METINFTVSVATFKAARSHAADRDVRYYLNGIYFDGANGNVVASDGHRMLIASGPRFDGAFICPNELIDQVLKTCTGRKGPMTVEGSLTNGVISFGVNGATFTANVVDGKFPDYSRVIPKLDPAAQLPPCINWHYMADAHNALALIRNHSPKKFITAIYASTVGAAGPVIVSDGAPDAMVIVMPMRHDMPEQLDLTWIFGKPANS